MIARVVVVKVAVFALVTVLGVGYTAYRYLGVGTSLFIPTYAVALDLADSGGIFTSAQVTYRGVGVGRVGEIVLRDDGIRVTSTCRRTSASRPTSGRSSPTARRSASSTSTCSRSAPRARTSPPGA